MTMDKSHLKQLRDALEDDDFDEDDIMDIFQDYMDDTGAADSLDVLEKFTEHGGYPDESEDAQFAVKSAEVQDDGVVFECDAHFQERLHGGGCADMASLYSLSATIKMHVDLSTGLITGSGGHRTTPKDEPPDWSVY